MDISRQDAFVEYAIVRERVMYRTALNLTAYDHAAAEDLLQTTLAELFSSWGRIRDPNLRDAYAHKAMVRTALRRRGHADSRSARLDAGDVDSSVRQEPTETDNTHEIDLRVDLQRYLRELPAKQRAVVVLRYLEDYTERQVAEVLGCSIGTVKSHNSRALRALRRQLDETRPATQHDHPKAGPPHAR